MGWFRDVLAQAEKRELLIKYWKCPICGVIVPDYRKSFESLETRVGNHLRKLHGGELTANKILGLLAELKQSYYRRE